MLETNGELVNDKIPNIIERISIENNAVYIIFLNLDVTLIVLLEYKNNITTKIVVVASTAVSATPGNIASKIIVTNPRSKPSDNAYKIANGIASLGLILAINTEINATIIEPINKPPKDAAGIVPSSANEITVVPLTTAKK